MASILAWVPVRLAFVMASMLAALPAHAVGPAATQAASRAEYRRLFAQLERTDFVREGAPDGQAKAILYVFFDGNCYYCHLTWKAVQPYERVGLQVRWIPVAYQKPSSVGRAAAILQAADRTAALRLNEARYDSARFDGGIAPLAKVDKALVAKLGTHTRLMQAFRAPGTPVVIWRDGAGDVQVKVGMLRVSQLPFVTGLPVQAVDDPELAQFQ